MDFGRRLDSVWNFFRGQNGFCLDSFWIISKFFLDSPRIFFGLNLDSVQIIFIAQTTMEDGWPSSTDLDSPPTRVSRLYGHVVEVATLDLPRLAAASRRSPRQSGVPSRRSPRRSGVPFVPRGKAVFPGGAPRGKEVLPRGVP